MKDTIRNSKYIMVNRCICVMKVVKDDCKFCPGNRE